MAAPADEKPKGMGDDFVFGSTRKGAKQYLEDAFFSAASANKKALVGAVFDGHGGYNGLVAAAEARDIGLAFFRQHALACESWSVDQWRQQLIQLFDLIHNSIRDRFVRERAPNEPGAKRDLDEKKIVRNANGDPVHGGSTGTVVVVITEDDGNITVVSANVGDSMALWVPLKASQERYRFLAVDHGPENADEFRRLQSLSLAEYPTKLLFVYDKANVFRKYECPRVFLDDGRKDPIFAENPWGHGLHPTNVRYEPGVYAVTPRNVSRDTTCIAMTRALGDFYAQQFGLSHVPDIQVHRFEKDTEFAITVASDGIWDCWRYEDFAQYVGAKINSGISLAAVVEGSLDETIQRAVSNFGSKSFDDAALVVIPSAKARLRLKKN